MFKRYFFLTLLFLGIGTSWADSADSLLKLISKTDDPYKIILYYNQIAADIREPFPDSAMAYYEKTLKLAKKLDDNTAYINAIGNIGVVWAIKNNLDSATFYVKQCMDLAEKGNSLRTRTKALNSLGLIELRRSNYNKAIKHFKEATEQTPQLNDLKLQSKIYNNLGLSYNYLYNYDSSLWYYLESLKIKEQIGDPRGIGLTTSNIALVYEKIGKYDLSITYLERSLSIRKNNSNKYGEAIVYNNLGLVYEHKQEYQKALEYYEKACGLMEPMKQKESIAACYNNIGSVYTVLKDFKKANLFLNKALKINIETKNSQGQANSYADLGDFYKEIRNNYKAIIYYKKSYIIASRINDIKLVTRCYKGLYYCYEQTGNVDSALLYYKNMVIFKDSITSQESRRRVELLEIDYQTLKKEKENQELIKENQINKARIRQSVLAVTLMAVFLVFFVLLSILTLRNRNKIKKAMAVISTQNIEIHHQAEELKKTYLQMKSLSEFKEDLSGMIVHDLKNPINTIINIADSFKKGENTLLIKHSGKKMLNLVMNILDVQKYEDKGMELCKLDAELRYIVSHAIEEIKYNAQLNNIIVITPQHTDYIVNVDTNVFERILINLLTNAIKFAPAETKIKIEFEELSKNQLKIHILDRGPGIDEAMLPKLFDKWEQAEKRNIGFSGSTGIGLSFCKMAIESHGGQIGVSSKEGIGSDFWILINYTRKITLGYTPQLNVAEKHFEELYLSFDAKEQLLPHVQRLSEYLVYQISDIKKIIHKLNQFNDSTIKKYTDELNNAVLSCNDIRYNELINMVLKPD